MFTSALGIEKVVNFFTFNDFLGLVNGRCFGIGNFSFISTIANRNRVALTGENVIMSIFACILQVPERIRAMNASIRLLLILREPVTRAISDYTQLKSHAASTTPLTKFSVQKSFEELAVKTDGEVNSSYR